MTQTHILSAIPIDPLTGAISVPIYQTATFVQEAPGFNKGYDYGRTGNPTRAALEQLAARLENGAGGLAFATGLAAIDAVLKTLSSGDEIVAVDDIYGGAFRLFTKVYEKFGIKVHYADTTSVDNLLAVINERTRLIWLETPTNPTLKITDIRAAAAVRDNTNALLVVDNTFASPCCQKPLDLGADIVIHSGTKYLGGHSDLLAGIVVCKTEALHESIKFYQNAAGGILGPQDAWLLIRGIETLPVRFEKQSRTALDIARFLQVHPAVASVNYPGLETHQNHHIAAEQQKGWYGGVLSFTLKEDRFENALAVCRHTRYFHLAESLGGVKSLICIPSEMTHKSVPKEKRAAAGISDSLIRISCGLEDAEDLIRDLETALCFVAEAAQV